MTRTEWHTPNRTLTQRGPAAVAARDREEHVERRAERAPAWQELA